MKLHWKIIATLCIWVSACAAEKPSTPPETESLVFLGAGAAVYRAFVSPNSAKVERISSPDERLWELTVIPSGKSVWLMQGHEYREQSGLSFQGLQVRFVGRPPRPKRKGSIALSPDGQTLAYLAAYGQRSAIICEKLNDGAVRVYPLDGRFAQAPAWSPDATKIAYYCSPTCSGNQSLRVLDVASRKDIEVAPASGRTGWAAEFRDPPVWSHTSDRLFFEARYGGPQAHDVPGPADVYEVSATGAGRPTKITSGTCYSISSDDKAIYVADNGIQAVSTAGPEFKRTPLTGEGPAGFPKISPSGRAIAYWRGDFYCKFLKENVEVLVCKGTFSSATRFYWISPPDKAKGDPMPSQEPTILEE